MNLWENSRGVGIWLALITGFGAVTRLFRLGHGLPELVQVDAFKFVDEAARMAATGEIRPQVVQFPGLLTHLLAVIYRVGDVTSETARHLIADHVVAGAGILLIPATFLLARKVCGARWALLPAALVAVCPASVSLARIPAPDILLTLFTVLALWLLLEPETRMRHLVAGGAAVGLALGSKFTAFYLVAMVPVIVLLAAPEMRWRQAAKRAATVLAVAAVVFTCTTPFFWLELPRYAERFLREMQIQRFGQIGRVQGGTLDYLFSATPTWEMPWLGTSLLANHGLVVLAIALAAVAAGLAWRGGRTVFLLAAFAALFLILISGPGRVKAFRFLLPVLPVLFVLVAWLVGKLSSRLMPRWQAAAAGVLAVAVLAVPVLRTATFVSLHRGPVTNTLADRWVRSQVPPGTRVFLSPFFVNNLAHEDLECITIPDVGSRQYARPEGIGPSPERRPIYAPEMVTELHSAGVRLVVLNSYFDGAFTPVVENLRFFPRSVASFTGFEERLQREADVAFQVRGMAEGRLGPDITVYRMR